MPTGKQKTRKQPTRPRIITLTVERLQRHAAWLDAEGYPMRGDTVTQWAAELDAYDGRETKLDPSKKAAKRRTASR